MFRSEQITTPTHVVRHFSRIARRLREYPEPILITQKHEQHLVLVPVDIFEDLVDSKVKLSLFERDSNDCPL